MPAFGPISMSLRSPEMLSRFVARDLNAAEKFMNGAKLFAISVRFFADLRGRPVSFDKCCVTRSLYFGSVFMPVPTAVPPRPMVWSFSACSVMNALDFLRAWAYASNSWPNVIGTAS